MTDLAKRIFVSMSTTPIYMTDLERDFAQGRHALRRAVAEIEKEYPHCVEAMKVPDPIRVDWTFRFVPGKHYLPMADALECWDSVVELERLQ